MSGRLEIILRLYSKDKSKRLKTYIAFTPLTKLSKEITMQSDKLSGTCACNQVIYELDDSGMYCQACHCLDCQRISGSSFIVNIWIEANRVHLLEGNTQQVIISAGRDQHTLTMCAHCNSCIWSRYHAAPGNTLFVKSGTLNPECQVAPRAHIFTRSKQDWMLLDETLPSFDSFYDMKKLWPAESLKRYRINIQESASI